MKQRYLVLTVCVTAAALTGSYIAHKKGLTLRGSDDIGIDSGLPTDLIPDPSANSGASEGFAKERHEIPLGTVLSYDLSYGGRLGDHRYKLLGNLELAVMTASAPQIGWARLTITNAPDALADLVPQLASGSYVRFEESGFGFSLPGAAELDRLGLPPQNLPAAARDFWRALGERLTVSLPGADQRDYVVSASRAGLRLESKHKYEGSCQSASGTSLRFEKTWQSPDRGADRAVSGESKGEFRPSCRGIARMELRETESINSADQRLTGETELTLRLNGETKKVIAEVSKEYVRTPSSEQPTGDSVQSGRSTERAIDAAQVVDLDESQLLATLRQQGGREQFTQDQYLQLKSWLALHPESIEHIKLALADYPVDDARVRGFVKALGAVGSDVAQETLVAMAKEHTASPDFAARVLTTLGFVARPSVEATKAVVAFAERTVDKELAQRAKLASGIMGSRLRQSSVASDQSRAADLESRIDVWLANATTDNERYDALAALGNLGPQNLAPIMKLISDKSSTAVLEEAYFALRFARDAAVVDFFHRSFLEASGANETIVRAAVVRALAARPPDDAWYRVVSDLAERPLAPRDTMALAESLARAQDSVNQGQVATLLDTLSQHTADPATKEQLTELRRGLAH